MEFWYKNMGIFVTRILKSLMYENIRSTMEEQPDGESR